MARLIARALGLAEAVARALAFVGLCALVAFAAATLVNGVSRAAFSAPIDLVGDVGSLVVAVAVASCFPMALIAKANIRIDVVTSSLPAGAARALGVVADVAVLAVVVAVARQMAVYASNTARAGDATAMLDIPTAPFWFAVAALLAVAALAQALVTLDEAARALAGLPPRLAASFH